MYKRVKSTTTKEEHEMNHEHTDGLHHAPISKSEMEDLLGVIQMRFGQVPEEVK